MTQEFIPYEQALALKKLGFDEPCFGTYRKNAINGNPFEYSIDFHTKVELDHNLCPKNSDYANDWVSAPTFSQAFRWFREKYTLYSIISTIMYTYPNLEFYFKIQGLNDGAMIDKFNTYEEAELACLIKLIEITKIKNI